MRCYTVTEERHEGITPVLEDGELYVQVGHGKPGTPEAKQAVWVPLGKTFRDLIFEMMNAGGLTDVPPIKYADFHDDGTKLIHQHDKKNKSALVLVQAPAGDNGRLIYTARSYEDRLIRGRVRQIWDPFVASSEEDSWYGTPLPGIEIVAAGVGPKGEAQCLLIMQPGASFRMLRTGNMGDAPPELFVKWPGPEIHLEKRGQLSLQMWTRSKHKKSEAA